jgi:pyridoxal biosynthesis lyase PdxS
MVLTRESGEAVPEHIADLTGQLTDIVRAGLDAGTFTSADPATTARAVFQATGRFHDPCHAGEWEQPGVDAEFEAVVELVVRGLRATA